MPHFYTAESAHGTRTSHGFSNDTVVKVWESKKSRDMYLDTCVNISTNAISRSDVTKYATNFSLPHNCEIKPNPFKGEYWAIETPDDTYDDSRKFPTGYVGCITIGNDDYQLSRFYK